MIFIMGDNGRIMGKQCENSEKGGTWKRELFSKEFEGSI